MHYTEIDTFEKVLAFKGETIEQFNERTKGMDSDTIGYEKIKAIAWVMNGGKHVTTGFFPTFYIPNRSVDRFLFRGYSFRNYDSDVSPDILIEDRDAAIFAGKTFLTEYSQFING